MRKYVKTYRVFESETNLIKGGLSDNLTLEDIAKKHGLPIEKLQDQLKKGIEIEKEHVGNNEQMAREIAMDHLVERPDYYDMLAKAEGEPLHESVIPERYKKLGFTKVGVKKRAPSGSKHKWEVLAKKGDRYKIVRGGWRGMEDYTQHKDPQRRKNFWNRMGGKNSKKANDPFSPLYWHKRFGTW